VRNSHCVIGIETSCDETAVAIYHGERGLLGHALHSQVALHAIYGGVVPEIASRDHIRHVLPLVRQVMRESDVVTKDLSCVAYTAGPGLLGALLVGAAFGRSFAFGLGIPAIGVHHMEGHLVAALLEPNAPSFPFLALLVSGGHTLLVHAKAMGQYQILGESLDDAVGEAFDKTAKLLGLQYPGGPEISKLAEKGNPDRFHFPRPMLDRPTLDFSFSGLKTHAITTFRSVGNDPAARADIARAFQDAVVDVLSSKCKRALRETGLKHLVVAGGVGANQALRARLHELTLQEGSTVHFPRPTFCVDNGAMIAYAGWLRFCAGERAPLVIQATPRWPIELLNGSLVDAKVEASDGTINAH